MRYDACFLNTWSEPLSVKHVAYYSKARTDRGVKSYDLYEVVEETHHHPDCEEGLFTTKILQIRLLESKKDGDFGSAKIKLLNNVEEIINEEIGRRDTK